MWLWDIKAAITIIAATTIVTDTMITATTISRQNSGTSAVFSEREFQEHHA